MKSGRHPFKKVMFEGRKVWIDKDIVPLLTKMWKLGIRTTNSCQASCSFVCDHKTKRTNYKNGTSYSKKIKTKNCHNSVWIAFDSVKEVEKLFNILAEYVHYSHEDYDTSMYTKMGCDLFVQTNKAHTPDGWSFLFFMCNRGTYGHWGRRTFGKKRDTKISWIEEGCGKNHFVIEPQITFPRAHMAYVESRLDMALARKKK